MVGKRHSGKADQLTLATVEAVNMHSYYKFYKFCDFEEAHSYILSYCKHNDAQILVIFHGHVFINITISMQVMKPLLIHTKKIVVY